MILRNSFQANDRSATDYFTNAVVNPVMHSSILMSSKQQASNESDPYVHPYPGEFPLMPREVFSRAYGNVPANDTIRVRSSRSRGFDRRFSRTSPRSLNRQRDARLVRCRLPSPLLLLRMY